MKEKRMSWQKKLALVVGILALVLLVCFGGFLWYASDYYRADATALQIKSNEDGITTQEDWTILASKTDSDTAIIFYPGAKVETEAYLPLLDQLRDIGVTCILVDMPFHMAILNSNAADAIIEQFPQIDHWYIAGHSMGGAMASSYASKNPDQIEGLFLMGAYIYGDYPLENTLTIYGSLDGLMADDIDYTTNVIKIEGGNHAQFGNYGPQEKDLPATITAQEQQAQTVAAIQAFLTTKQALPN